VWPKYRAKGEGAYDESLSPTAFHDEVRRSWRTAHLGAIRYLVFFASARRRLAGAAAGGAPGVLLARVACHAAFDGASSPAKWWTATRGGEGYVGPCRFIWARCPAFFVAAACCADRHVRWPRSLSEVCAASSASHHRLPLEILATIRRSSIGCGFSSSSAVHRHPPSLREMFAAHCDSGFGKGTSRIFQFRGFPDGLAW